MSIFKRIADAAVRSFRTPTPNKIEIRAVPPQLIWPDLSETVFGVSLGQRGYNYFAGSGYLGNALIYAAIQYKARTISTAPLRAYVPAPNGYIDAPENNSIAIILNNPNTYQSMTELLALSIIYLNLDGNAFIYVSRHDDGSIAELIPLRPDKVKVICDEINFIVKGFTYRQDAKDDPVSILPDDMIHVKLPNPLDKYDGRGRGASPLQAAAGSLDVDNAVTRFLDSFFERGAMLPGYIKVDAPLEESEMARIRERWREIYGGVENWSDVGVFDQMGDYVRLGLNFDEMEFSSIDGRNETRLLMVFGVPPILIGSEIGLERSTFSNYEEARRAFWQDVMWPELMMFQGEFQRLLNSPDGTIVRFDTSQVPALQTNLNAATEGAERLWKMGVPANIAFQAMGLDIEQYDGDDVSYPGGIVAQDESDAMTALSKPARRRASEGDADPKWPSG